MKKWSMSKVSTSRVVLLTIFILGVAVLYGIFYKASAIRADHSVAGLLYGASFFWYLLMLPCICWRRGWIVPFLIMLFLAICSARWIFFWHDFGFSIYGRTVWYNWYGIFSSLFCASFIFLTRKYRVTYWGMQTVTPTNETATQKLS